jgi:hypothetical protein
MFSTVAIADLFDNCAKVKPGTNALGVAAQWTVAARH